MRDHGFRQDVAVLIIGRQDVAVLILGVIYSDEKYCFYNMA